MIVMAIDPGPVRSAWLAIEDDEIRNMAISLNRELVDLIRSDIPAGPVDVLVIEKVEGFGMPVGAEVFETVYWSGRFAEAARPKPVERIGRKAIKLHLCGSMRAKDPNIRQALIDRFGGSSAIGRKATPGPLYGVSADLWSALAVAVSWADGAR